MWLSSREHVYMILCSWTWVTSAVLLQNKYKTNKQTNKHWAGLAKLEMVPWLCHILYNFKCQKIQEQVLRIWEEFFLQDRFWATLLWRISTHGKSHVTKTIPQCLLDTRSIIGQEGVYCSVLVDKTDYSVYLVTCVTMVCSMDII